MKHLVTGGSGFLGNLIARRLAAVGEEVTILDIWDDPTRPQGIDFIHCDVLDREGVAKAMRGVHVVHNNVALVPLTKAGDRFWRVNVEGSRIVAEEAVKANVRSLIHMSSSAIYQAGVCPITTETPSAPCEIYGKSKLAGEQAVLTACKNSPVSLIVIRPRTILGVGRLGIFQVLFQWISENRNVYVIGSGDHLFQFIHAHDLMDFYMLAMKNGTPGVYNVGTDRYGTLRGDLERLIAHAGSRSKVRSLPESLTINSLRFLDWMGVSPLAPWHYLTYHKAFYFDVKPLLDMGWKPKYSNDEMLQESYDSFLKRGTQTTLGQNASPHRRSIQEGVLRIIKKLS